MERSITLEEEETIKQLGALGYGENECAAIMEWPEEETRAAFKNKNSAFSRLYERGKVRAEFIIDRKLYEQAAAGDIKSLDKLEHRKRRRK